VNTKCTMLEVMLDRLRAGLWRACGVTMGRKIRVGTRCRVTRPEGVSLGFRTWLEADVWLKLTSPSARLEVGAYSFFSRNCTINVIEKVTIGSHVLFGPSCLIIDHNHGTDAGCRIDEQPCVSKPVCIQDSVWCGAGVVVLPGVTIGEGAVIGANAVVTHDIPAMAVAVGNPAHVIRMREAAQP